MSSEHEKEFSLPNKREGLRLLGSCPACNTEDGIVRYPGNPFEELFRVRCEDCGTVWSDWRRLVREQEQEGNRLIAVEIERLRHEGLGVVFPRKIPHLGLVASVFSAALIVRFNLRMCFATEGGVEGAYRGSYIELMNNYGNLGLNRGEDDSRTRETIKVLDFYQELVGLLLQKDFEIGKKYYRRGEILRLPQEEQSVEKTWEILIAILVKAKNRKFARKVVGELARNAGKGFAPYLRGLTDEEIAEHFVPPPLWF